MKPLIKWPGGKRFLANSLSNVFKTLPMRRYIEPFAGGAAVFFSLKPQSSLIADSNEELMNMYAVVRDDPEGLIRSLQRLRNSAAHYYAVRASNPRKAHTRAARFYYLMRLSFNGIYRENRDGLFNVPYGQKLDQIVLDPTAIYEASEILKGASLHCQDFRSTSELARVGDLVYFDPPYTLVKNSDRFIKYNRKLFAWDDQEDLARVAKDLVDRGCFVVVSNADHEDIHTMYCTFSQILVPRLSRISAKNKGRGVMTERLMVSNNILNTLCLTNEPELNLRNTRNRGTICPIDSDRIDFTY